MSTTTTDIDADTNTNTEGADNTNSTDMHTAMQRLLDFPIKADVAPSLYFIAQVTSRVYDNVCAAPPMLGTTAHGSLSATLTRTDGEHMYIAVSFDDNYQPNGYRIDTYAENPASPITHITPLITKSQPSKHVADITRAIINWYEICAKED